jgi:16S rRNA (guanine527-N7)-methyltransferase
VVSALSTRIDDRAVRLASIHLSRQQLQQLEQYLQLLERWNRSINLTAVPLAGFPDASIDRLVVEPLFALPFLAEGPRRWFDLGSGGGTPAIPLKIVRRDDDLTMVESRSRKASFLREVARALPLARVKVVAARIEEMETAGRSGAVDFITIRGLRLGEGLTLVVQDLLKIGGRLLFFTGGNATPPPLGGTMAPVGEMSLPGGAALKVYEKQRGLA